MSAGRRARRVRVIDGIVGRGERLAVTATAMLRLDFSEEHRKCAFVALAAWRGRGACPPVARAVCCPAHTCYWC